MPFDSLPAWIRGDRYALLLISLVATLFLQPLFAHEQTSRVFSSVCLTLVFLTGVLANRHRKAVCAVALVLALAAILLGWICPSDSLGFFQIHLVVDLVFLGFTAVMIFIAVVKDRMPGIHSVLGAICVYLLLGLTWAYGYRLVESIEPESFRFTERLLDSTTAGGQPLTDKSQMIYFSFVTMSTLGYGDITPRTPLAQTVTWMQAVTGQFYLIILIAKLVNELPRRHEHR